MRRTPGQCGAENQPNTGDLQARANQRFGFARRLSPIVLDKPVTQGRGSYCTFGAGFVAVRSYYNLVIPQQSTEWVVVAFRACADLDPKPRGKFWKCAWSGG